MRTKGRDTKRTNEQTNKQTNKQLSLERAHVVCCFFTVSLHHLRSLSLSHTHSVSLSLCHSVLPLCPSMYLFVCLFVCLSVCLSVCLFFCVSACAVRAYRQPALLANAFGHGGRAMQGAARGVRLVTVRVRPRPLVLLPSRPIPFHSIHSWIH